MTIEATIIVPTHNHGATLARSVRSALCQTVRDVEVVILGDGATEATVATATAMARSDPRVRFHANPKHESRGEPHRDRAVRESRANFICYLSDDDLYLPDHVETVIGLLRKADFVHAVPVHIDGNGARDANHRSLDSGAQALDCERGQPHPAFHRCPFAISLRKPGARLAHTSAVGAE